MNSVVEFSDSVLRGCSWLGERIELSQVGTPKHVGAYPKLPILSHPSFSQPPGCRGPLDDSEPFSSKRPSLAC